jgi:hypothetical protein
MEARAPSMVEVVSPKSQTIQLEHLPKLAKDALTPLDTDGSGTLDVAEITAAVNA